MSIPVDAAPSLKIIKEPDKIPKLREQPIHGEVAIPQDVQSLIDAYRKYVDFKQTFQKLETDSTFLQDLKPPWDKIQEKIQANKRRVNNVLQLSANSEKPEELGRSVYDAKNKVDDSPPTGNVSAYQRGSQLIIVVDHQEDFNRLSNFDPHDAKEGVYSLCTYKFESDSGKHVIDSVPTIVVLRTNSNQDTTIRHEENHYHIEMYKNEVDIENVAKTLSERFKTQDTIQQFASGEISQDTLLDQLRMYANHTRVQAIEEIVSEQMATGRADFRSVYVDQYFEQIKNLATRTSPEASQLVDQVKDEFIQSMNQITMKIATATSSLTDLGEDFDTVYGTVGMRLLMSNGDNIDQTVDSIGFLQLIRLSQEAVNLRQDIYNFKKDPRKNSTEESATQIQAITDQFGNLVRQYSALDSFGFRKAKQDGKDFPIALTEAAINRAQYLEQVQTIELQLANLSTPIEVVEARDILKEISSTDEQPSNINSPQQRQKGGLLRRILKK